MLHYEECVHILLKWKVDYIGPYCLSSIWRLSWAYYTDNFKSTAQPTIESRHSSHTKWKTTRTSSVHISLQKNIPWSYLHQCALVLFWRERFPCCCSTFFPSCPIQCVGWETGREMAYAAREMCPCPVPFSIPWQWWDSIPIAFPDYGTFPPHFPLKWVLCMGDPVRKGGKNDPLGNRNDPEAMAMTKSTVPNSDDSNFLHIIYSHLNALYKFVSAKKVTHDNYPSMT